MSVSSLLSLDGGIQNKLRSYAIIAVAMLLLGSCGFVGDKIYKSRDQPNKIISKHAARARIAVSLILGLAIGMLMSFLLSINVSIYKTFLIYVAFATLVVIAGYTINRLTAVANEEDSDKRQSLAANSSVISYTILGIFIGIIMTVIIRLSSRIPAPIQYQLQVLGGFFLLLNAVGHICNLIIYFTTRPNTAKTYMIISFVLGILSIAGALGCIIPLFFGY